MRPLLMSIFLILLCGMAAPQSVPPGWKIVKDDKGQCQMAVPPDWTVSKGMAFHKNTPPDQAEVAFDTETVVPMVERMQKMWHVDQMFENTSNRVFYSVGGGRSKDFRVRVPRAGGACNATVTFGPPTTEETVKKIILTLGSAK